MILLYFSLCLSMSLYVSLCLCRSLCLCPVSLYLYHTALTMLSPPSFAQYSTDWAKFQLEFCVRIYLLNRREMLWEIMFDYFVDVKDCPPKKDPKEHEGKDRRTVRA